MNVLLPNLIINDTSIRVDRQQCVLRPSKAAYEIKIRNSKQKISAPSTISEKLLWMEDSALDEARRLAKSLGPKTVNPISEKEYLGQLVLTFGKYVNCSFKWLLENDVGYVKYLLDHHFREKKKLGSVRDAWLKNLLQKYVDFFPPVSSHLEENIDHCTYGQGDSKNLTYEEMFKHYHQYKTNPSAGNPEHQLFSKKIYESVRRWLCMLPNNITTNAMKRFQLYIKEKEKCTVPASKFSPSKLDSTWTDDSVILAAMEMETIKDKPLLRKAHTATSTVSKAPSDSQPVLLPDSSSSSIQSKRIDKPEVIKDLSAVVYEGWHKTWEDDSLINSSIPSEDRHWLKMDTERGLFQPSQTFRDIKGNLRIRKVLKTDRMWFYPPDTPGVVHGQKPSPDAFFHSRLFFWRPVGVWGYSLRCPRPNCPARDDKNAFLYRNGYYVRAKQICDISDWYTMLTEVLSCAACNKNADSNLARFLAWDPMILSQLSESHQAVFPAVLTARRGFDKKVVKLMMDRSAGNTMAKVWRQIEENHSLQFLERKDLYTTLLYTLSKKGGIVKALDVKFKPPPKRRELPTPKMFRTAFLIAEANHVDDYRTQIMSTFGKILKFDSTKKICKKISGEGRGTAEWCTNVGNELSQIVTFVLTCEESNAKLQIMAEGLMDRYKRAGETPPLVMYVDRGCCRKFGPSAVEKLFHFWVDSGMCIRLDAWHWIHRFDAAVRTDTHPKYAAFKSALSGSLFAYNRSDLQLLIKAIRAGDSNNFETISDDDIIKLYVSKSHLQHHVRRITVGVQETFNLVNTAIEELKTEVGFDANGISLFKSEDAINEVWTGQQKHLECLQDPPDLSLYTVVRETNINGIKVPYYRCSRGNNSLEGFHSHLVDMVPGDHCAIQSFQIYLLSGVARWNADREFDAVKGGHGRSNRVYSTSLIHRLNTRCQTLFGEEEEVNFRPPVPPGNELLGIEYLLNQSLPNFDLQDHYSSIKNFLSEKSEKEEDNVDDADESLVEDDPGYSSEVEDQTVPEKPVKIPVTDLETAPDLDPFLEDVCGINPLPGYNHVERLSCLLATLAEEEGRLSLTSSQQLDISNAFNLLHEHDKNPKKFRHAYCSKWGNTLYKRTHGDPTDAAVTQKVKFGVRFSPAHHIDNSNRLVYCVIKQLWLKLDSGVQSSSTLKNRVTTYYQRMQHRLMVEDPVLSRLGIPLPKINTKCVGEFIRRQEAIISLNSTRQAKSMVAREKHVTDIPMPEPEELPPVRPQPDRPQVPLTESPCLAGEKTVRRRGDLSAPILVKPKVVILPSPPPYISKTASTVLPSTAKPTSIPRPVFNISYIAPQIPSTSNFIPAQSSTPFIPPFIPVQSSTPFIPISTQPTSAIHQISRSTFYKYNKQERQDSGIPIKKRKPNIPTCNLCHKPSQGHKKYKKKTWCEESKRSTSKGLMNRTFTDFEDFKKVVDELS